MKIKLPDTKSYIGNYIKCVYKDPDFLSYIGELKKKNIGDYLESCGKEHLPKDIQKIIRNTENEFDINWEDIELYLLYPDRASIRTGILSAGINDIGKIDIEMDPELTQEDFIGFWPIIEGLKKQVIGNQRNRGFDFPEIAYEIYIRRKKGEKLIDISQSLSASYDDVRRIYKKLKTVIDNYRS